jgi:hypothetical protein
VVDQATAVLLPRAPPFRDPKTCVSMPRHCGTCSSAAVGTSPSQLLPARAFSRNEPRAGPLTMSAARCSAKGRADGHRAVCRSRPPITGRLTGGRMIIELIDPRDIEHEVDQAVYRVYFWHRPPPPQGVTPEYMAYHCEEYRVEGP